MTQPEGRAMKYGIIEQIISGDFRGNSKKVRILLLKKSVEKEKESRVKNIADAIFFTPELCGGAQSSLGVNEKSSSRISR